MAIDVQIGGQNLRWRLRHSDRLADWIASRPWHEQGGTKVIRVSNCELIGEASAYLRQEIWAADDRSSNVEVLCTTPEDGTVSSLGEGLSLVLRGCRSEEPLRDLRREIAEQLNRAPLIIVMPALGGSGISILQQAVIMVDEISKSDALRPLTIVLYDTVSDSVTSDYFDLSVGYPVAPLFDQDLMSQGELWMRYLHHRCAWEAAGNPLEARGVLGSSLAGVSLFDDDAVEIACNAYASERMQQVTLSNYERFSEYLLKWGDASGSSDALRQAERELLRAGLLWIPIGHAAARPVCWAARAVLLNNTFGSQCFTLLRNCTVPVPMASEVLGKCFELEMHERAYYSPARQAGTPPLEVSEKHRKFLAGSPGSAAAFYPPSCPAIPDVWAFASLGAYFEDLPTDSTTTKRAQLRVIRNALSHGHHVGWKVISSVRQIQDVLLSSNRNPARVHTARASARDRE